MNGELYALAVLPLEQQASDPQWGFVVQAGRVQKKE